MEVFCFLDFFFCPNRWRLFSGASYCYLMSHEFSNKFWEQHAV